VIIHKFKKMTYKQRLFYTIVVLFFIISIAFVYNNYSFYDRPVAQVIETNVVDTSEVTDHHNNKDKLFMQNIIAEVKNGEKKGQLIHLTNEYSSSGAYDQPYQSVNELFISIDKNKEKNADLTGTIEDVKRDKYIMIVAWVFIFTLLIIGKRQGLFSIIGLAVNAGLLSYALDVYVNNANMNLLFIWSISAVLFTFIFLVVFNGLNEAIYLLVGRRGG